MKVYEALQILKNKGPRYLKHGICSNVQDVFDFNNYDVSAIAWIDNSKSAFEDWDKFSGDAEYPIEGTPEEYRRDKMNRWDKQTYFGSLRCELLDHLIAWFKEKDI